MARLRLVAAALSLLALIPGAVFLLDRMATVVVLSMACVLLTAGSLYVMFGGEEPTRVAPR